MRGRLGFGFCHDRFAHFPFSCMFDICLPFRVIRYAPSKKKKGGKNTEPPLEKVGA